MGLGHSSNKVENWFSSTLNSDQNALTGIKDVTSFNFGGAIGQAKEWGTNMKDAYTGDQTVAGAVPETAFQKQVKLQQASINPNSYSNYSNWSSVSSKLKNSTGSTSTDSNASWNQTYPSDLRNISDPNTKIMKSMARGRDASLFKTTNNISDASVGSMGNPQLTGQGASESTNSAGGNGPATSQDKPNSASAGASSVNAVSVSS